MGLRPEGELRAAPADPPWHLWPCNARTWQLWCGLQTQWRRVGLDGAAIGLDYAAVWSVLDHSTVPPRRRRETFEHLQAMERAALEVFAERKK